MLLRQQTNLLEAREEVRVDQGPKTLLDRGLEFVRRQFWILLFCLVVAMLGASAFLFFVPPAYTAASTMMIDSRKGGVQQKSVLGDTPTDSIWIDSQMGILGLQRDQIGQAVAKKLQLGKSSKDLEPGEGWGTLFGLLGSTPRKDATQSEAELTQMAAGMVSGALDVRRVGLSYLVNISFTSPKPDLAVKIANAAADAYVIAEMDAKFKNLSQASNWLQDRYQTLKDQATQADRAVVEFKSKNKIVTAGGKLINDQQLTEINNRLGAAHAKTADAQARLNQIEGILIADQRTPGGTDATVTDALSNPIISGLRKQYLDLINREADWSKRFGKNHLAVVNLRNQARDIRISTLEELKRIHETYKSDLEIAKQNESELEKQLSSIVAQIPNEAQITLRGLESSAQSYRAFTDNFLLTYNESVQQQTSPIPETRVIAYATYAGKSFPSTGRVLTLSLLGGLALGIGLGMFREMMDRAFRTGRQTQAALRVECIAMVPLVKSGATSFRKKLFSSGQGRELMTKTRNQIITAQATSLFRLVSDDPFSQFAEAIRAIKLAADVRGASSSSKVIGLTSSVPREGKSTIAAALAGQIAQVGCRVVLVDCDLRNPALSRSLAPDASIGVLEVISGRQSLDVAICKDPVTGMAFLPTANAFGVPNTDQILSSEAMKRLFETLRSQYEYIIVDLSPLAPVVDVRATTDLIDFYVFIVEWGATKIDMVQQTLQQAQSVYDNVLGVVLNKVNMDAMGRYDGERASYYTAKYYSGAQG